MAMLQRAFVAQARACLPAGYVLAEEVAPAWLLRPGQAECGDAWGIVQEIYAALTGGELPRVMPARERRRLDAVLRDPTGRERAVEIDETQHFTAARAITLQRYTEAEVPVAFDVSAWLSRCWELTGREPRGGGWAAPKPPVFPGPGGRHRQRAFRDFLADLLPPRYGWHPTRRISDLQARAALEADDPGGAVLGLLLVR